MADYITLMQPYFDDISVAVSKGDPLVISVITAIVVGIITILLLIVRGRSKSKTGVLVVGLCDAGKTLLFGRLVHGKYCDTFTSIKENSGQYKVEETGKVLDLHDLPGHERVREQFLDKHKNTARAVVFLVDSLTFQKEIKDVAEYLYSVLTDPVISYSGLPLLVACNKQDFTVAKGSKVIRGQLEKEMNTLRITKSAALAGTDSGSGLNNNMFLGRKDRDFSFADLKTHRVTFVECFAKSSNNSEKANTEAVEGWLRKIA